MPVTPVYTTPVNVTAGEADSGQFNTQVLDNIRYLYLRGPYVCTAATRPATPTEGDLIFETDTDRLYIYSGAAWKFVHALSQEHKVEVFFLCSTAAATTSGSMTDWINTGNATVPTWATKARVTVSINGMSDVTTANHTYALRVLIGTDAGSQIVTQGKGVGIRFGESWNCPITLTSTGLKAFKIQAARLGGANTLTVDGSCTVTALIEFLA